MTTTTALLELCRQLQLSTWTSSIFQACEQACRQQQSIGCYIVDFICLEAKLIIEADGGDHNIAETIRYDTNHTTELEKHGYRVIRFWNDEISNQIEAVLESIAQALENSSILTLPLS